MSEASTSTSKFMHAALKKCVAVICQNIGFQGIYSVPLDVMTDLLHRYLREMAVTTHNFAEHDNRTLPSLGDLEYAFNEMKVSIGELEEYVNNVDSSPFPETLPPLPLPRPSELNFLKPGSKEILSRPIHIHEHLPPMLTDMEDEEAKEMNANEEDSNSIGLSEPNSPSLPNGEVVNPSQSSSKYEVLSMKEVDSVMMTTSGYISSSRAGKMPDTRMPNMPLPIFPSIPTSVSSSSRSSATNNEAASAAAAAAAAAQKKKLSLERLMRHKQKMAAKKAAQASAIKSNSPSTGGGGSSKPPGGSKKALSHSAVMSAAHDAAMCFTTKHGKSKDKVKPKIPATPPGTSSSLNSSFLRNQSPLQMLANASQPKAASTPHVSKLPPVFQPPKLKIPTPKIGSSEFSTDVLPLPKEHIKEQEERKLQMMVKEKQQKELVEAAANGTLHSGGFPSFAKPKKDKDKKKLNKDIKKEKSDKSKKDSKKEKLPKKEEKDKKKRKEEKKKEKSVKKQKLFNPMKSPKSIEKKVKKLKKPSESPNILSPVRVPDVNNESQSLDIADFDKGKLCIFKKSSKSGQKEESSILAKSESSTITNEEQMSHKRPRPFDMEADSFMPSKKGRLNLSSLSSSEDLSLSVLSDVRPPTPGSVSTGPFGGVNDPIRPPSHYMPAMSNPNFLPPFMSNSDFSGNLDVLDRPLTPNASHRPPTPGRSDPALSGVQRSPLYMDSPQHFTPEADMRVTPVINTDLDHEKKKKEKEHKKEKKDKGKDKDKIKKKKDKKEKTKLDKLDKKILKEKQRRDKARESKKKPEKILKKVSSPDPATPKIVIKRSEASERSTDLFELSSNMAQSGSKETKLSSSSRPVSPELAKIAPLIHRPPKSSHKERKVEESSNPPLPSLKIKELKSKGDEGDKREHSVPDNSSKKVLPPAPAPEVTPPAAPAASALNPIGHFVDEQGNEVWICPNCGRQDDGSPMIGCDTCDDWYHWVCVGIQVPPNEAENWYCPRCLMKQRQKSAGEITKKDKKRHKDHVSKKKKL